MEKNEIRKVKKETRKQFERMLKYMKKKGLYSGNFVHIRVDSDYTGRFNINKKIYAVVNKYWNKELVPFVIEVVYTFDVLCYRHKVRNLIGMFLCDLEYNGRYKILSKTDIQKMELLNMAFEMPMGNQEGISVIDWSYIEKAKSIVKRLKELSWHEYYSYIVKPIANAISKEGALNELFAELDWKVVSNKLQLREGLEEDIIEFLILDALDYVDACDCFDYNPYWVFGTKRYSEILNEMQLE